MKVLSIDPGYGRCGMAVISGTSGNEDLLFSTCFETKSGEDFPDRLADIGEKVENLITEYEPTALAIEKLYFSKNTKTAMKVAQTKGAIIFIARTAGLDVYEHDPQAIKSAVTGYGKSTKQQVVSMTEQLISIEKEITHDDEYDAIAVGLTCIATHSRKY